MTIKTKRSENIKGVIDINDFVRYPKGSVMYYEIIGKDLNYATDCLRKPSHRGKVRVNLISGFDASRKPIHLARVEVIEPVTSKRQKNPRFT